jgi:hypothetical protein
MELKLKIGCTVGKAKTFGSLIFNMTWNATVQRLVYIGQWRCHLQRAPPFAFHPQKNPKDCTFSFLGHRSLGEGGYRGSGCRGGFTPCSSFEEDAAVFLLVGLVAGPTAPMDKILIQRF